jgi:hypothetical protein
MSYITLRGLWCEILNVYAPTEDKTDDTKNSFYEELEPILDQFSMYTWEFYWHLNAKLGREGIFKATIINDNIF